MESPLLGHKSLGRIQKLASVAAHSFPGPIATAAHKAIPTMARKFW